MIVVPPSSKAGKWLRSICNRLYAYALRFTKSSVSEFGETPQSLLDSSSHQHRSGTIVRSILMVVKIYLRFTMCLERPTSICKHWSPCASKSTFQTNSKLHHRKTYMEIRKESEFCLKRNAFPRCCVRGNRLCNGFGVWVRTETIAYANK